MVFYVHEGAGGRSEGATSIGGEMAGGTSSLPRDPPSSVEESMFKILGRLLKDLYSTVGGEDAWNTSLLGSGATGRKTRELMAQEDQEGNVDVRLVLLVVRLRGRLHMSNGKKTGTSPTHSSSIASYPQGTASLG